MPSDYADLAHLFIDLRGRGASLSSTDLNLLHLWQKKGIQASFVAKVMCEYAEECKVKKKTFPLSLTPIAQKLGHILLKSRES